MRSEAKSDGLEEKNINEVGIGLGLGLGFKSSMIFPFRLKFYFISQQLFNANRFVSLLIFLMSIISCFIHARVFLECNSSRVRHLSKAILPVYWIVALLYMLTFKEAWSEDIGRLSRKV